MILLFFLSRLFFFKIVFIPGPGSWRLTSSFHLLFFLLGQQDVKEREREKGCGQKGFLHASHVGADGGGWASQLTGCFLNVQVSRPHERPTESELVEDGHQPSIKSSSGD